MTFRYIYAGNIRHETLLLQWWALLAQGELEKVLHRSLHTPVAFCAYFCRPGMLRFCLDEHGIWFAFWAEPMMEGAGIGLWVRQDMRRKKISAEAVQRALSNAFKEYPILLATTTQQSVQRLAVIMGFIYQCELPGLMEARKVTYLLTQTAEQWADFLEYEAHHGLKR